MKTRHTGGARCTSEGAETLCTRVGCVAGTGRGRTRLNRNPNRSPPTIGARQVSQAVALHLRQDFRRRGRGRAHLSSVRVVVGFGAPDACAPGAAIHPLPLLPQQSRGGARDRAWLAEPEIQVGNPRAKPMDRRYREDTLRRVPLGSVSINVPRVLSSQPVEILEGVMVEGAAVRRTMA